MNINEKFVITINREFGTGGHEIGEKLAEKLNARLLDKDLLKALREKFNITDRQIEEIKDQKTHWWDDFTRFYSAFMQMNEYMGEDREITPRQLYETESKLIREIAGKESIVLIGRCGFHIFDKHPNCLKIFVTASMDNRIKRILGKYDNGNSHARELLEDYDKRRYDYTKNNTGKDRYDIRNYNLVVDSGELGVDGTVDLILDYISKSEN